MKKIFVVSAVLAAALLTSPRVGAVTVFEDKANDRSLAVGVLLQPQVQTTEDGAPNGQDFGTDFFLRRARLYVAGEVLKGLTFFFQTDQPNWGKGGNFTVPFYVQDAFISYQVDRALTVDSGFFLVPLEHQTLEGTATLHPIDYHGAVILFPATFGILFRDLGLEARGLLLNDRIHYRLAVLAGTRGPDIPTGAAAGTPDLNPDAEPRFTGQLRFNLYGVEDKFLFNGIYFSDTPMISVGIGGDFQRNSVRTPTGVADYGVVSGDLFFEYPLSADEEVILKGDVADWREGSGSASTGVTAWGEAGFRIAWIEPLVGADWFHAEQGLKDYTAIRPGLNFWLRRHTFNIKAEAAWTSTHTPSTGTDRAFVATLQGQVFF